MSTSRLNPRRAWGPRLPDLVPVRPEKRENRQEQTPPYFYCVVSPPGKVLGLSDPKIPQTETKIGLTPESGVTTNTNTVPVVISVLYFGVLRLKRVGPSVSSFEPVVVGDLRTVSRPGRVTTPHLLGWTPDGRFCLRDGTNLFLF